jgi:hypothetical protein
LKVQDCLQPRRRDRHDARLAALRRLTGEHDQLRNRRPWKGSELVKDPFAGASSRF